MPMSSITVSSLPALLSTSLPTRSPSPSRRGQKGHVDRDRLPSFYVVAAARDARSHCYFDTGFRRVVEAVASNGGVVWNAIRAPSIVLWCVLFSRLQTSKILCPTVVFANWEHHVQPYPWNVPQKPTGKSIDTTMDLKLAASTSTSDSPRFRLPLDKSSDKTHAPVRLGTVCVPVLVGSTPRRGVDAQLQLCNTTSCSGRRGPLSNVNTKVLGAYLCFLFHRKDVASALLFNPCTNTSTRHLSRGRQTLDLTADDDVNLALRRGCEIRLRLTVDRRNNSFGYVPVKDSLAACRLERCNITGDASVTETLIVCLKI
ncbi:hypothetical protein BDZ89DRAFT_1042556 [Hymenopellis radicata]|nr:hypothetical protein BDZ89DRAFT_1042556 [Hymenopellis radicata]